MSMDGIDLYWRDEGTGPAVLLLHGSPKVDYGFAPLVEALENRYRVLYPDLPGFGRSPAQRPPVRFEVTHTSLWAGLAQREVESVAIVGLSLGAHLALGMAGRPSGCPVRSVVALGGFAAVTPEHASALEELADAMDGGMSPLEPPLFDQLAEAGLSAGWRDAHPESIEELRECFRRSSPRDAIPDLRACRGSDLRAFLRGCPVPVTLRVGSHDQATPVAYSEELMRVLPNAELQIVEGAGHLLLVEDQEATIAAISEALDSARR